MNTDGFNGDTQSDGGCDDHSDHRCEYRFYFHGVELRLSTSSPAFVAPVLTFLRHFHAEEVRGDTALTIHFEEVASRADVPVKVSDIGKESCSPVRDRRWAIPCAPSGSAR